MSKTNEDNQDTTGEITSEDIPNLDSEALAKVLEDDGKGEQTDEDQPDTDEDEEQPSDDEENDGSEETEETDDIEELRNKVANLEKRLTDKDSFIDKRNSEIGDLRTKEKELLKKIEKSQATNENFEEDFYNNPQEVVKDVLAGERAQQELEANQARQRQYETEDAMESLAPDLKTYVADMVECLREDRYDETILAQFTDNPFIAEKSFLYNLYRRAKATKEVKELTTKVAKKSVESKDVIAKVAKASKASPKLTNSDGSSDSTSTLKPLNRQQISELPYEELQERLKQES